jgi:hypothetical protein
MNLYPYLSHFFSDLYETRHKEYENNVVPAKGKM